VTDVKRQTHYEQYDIQPVDFIVETVGPGWLVGNVIKYVMRYNEKNGVEDLKKAAHYVEMLINVTEGRKPRDSKESEGVSETSTEEQREFFDLLGSRITISKDGEVGV